MVFRQSKSFAVILGAFWFLCAIFGARADAPVWGVNAITLRTPDSAGPSLGEILTNADYGVSLNRFYRVGGSGLAHAGTECRVAYDTNSLIVVFRCSEPDLPFLATNRNVDWFSLLSTPFDQDSSFPDKVDLFIRPRITGPDFYQFTVTLAGQKFGCERQTRYAVESDEDAAKARGHNPIRRLNAFAATVTVGTNEWSIFIRIPWKTLGGKPGDCFGLLPVRTRWRDGEVSSPVAFDFIERPPMDLFVETHFSPGKRVADGSLCRLPSGVSRWQRPALLTYPDSKTVHDIWQMEQSLHEPTTTANFAERLWLTQRWTDLLTLEGFNFRLGRGSIVTNDLSPFDVRRRVNLALEKGDNPTAWRTLDGYLHRLDHVSRKWFADGSPGDIEPWTPVSRLTGVQTNENVLCLHCLAGSRSVDLHLSLPKSGGIRIYGDDEGYFKPVDLLPLTVLPSSDYFAVATSSGGIVISQDPFFISFHDSDGNVVMSIGANDLSFRFGPDGKIAAVDFKNGLDPNEVIFGFGERYDRFNENGNVLTLWGMDDWFGNTVGLMNQTYKPIALFHSSEGYSVFDNSTYRLRADIGKTDSHRYRLTQTGPIFDFYFWIGSPQRAIESYTSLTGKPVLPPAWAFEPWMGRTGRGWEAASHDAIAEEERVTKQFGELDIPHSAIYAEGSSADSSQLNRFMAARDIHVLSWYWPVISEPQQVALLPKVKNTDLPLLNAGNEKASRDLGYVDFSNPNAMELCRRWWRHRLDVGVAGSMVDFGDRVPEEAIFCDGKRGDEMHNFYAYDYHRTYSEVFREKRDADFILFGRAAAPGDQRWVAQFAGDHPSNFIGLQSVLTGALNLCGCGFSTWGSDLGGFMGWPEPAVYIRWTQFGCFSPLMRCHGRTPREPWDYGEAAVANYKFCAWVRENLLNYIYNAAAYAHDTGIPIMRSMAFAYPGDVSDAANSGEYMFGRDLLIAPVVTEDNNKKIVIPAGQWTDLWNGQNISGPTNFTTYVPLDTIPVYLKPGAIVPVYLNRQLQFGQSMNGGRVKALIITPPNTNEEAAFEYDAVPASSKTPTLTHGATVALQHETNRFAITLDRFGLDYLLIYGADDVASVRVDGVNLPNVSEIKPASIQGGWRADSASNRIIIRLPPNESRMEIEIAF